MPLNPDAIFAHPFDDRVQTVSAKDAMLYALSIGLGRDPMDLADLRYVCEDDLRMFPTMPVVLGDPGNWMADPKFGVTRQMLVHGTQRLEIFGNLRPDMSMRASNKVIELVDKGPEGGGIVVMQRTLSDSATGAVL